MYDGQSGEPEGPRGKRQGSTKETGRSTHSSAFQPHPPAEPGPLYREPPLGLGSLSPTPHRMSYATSLRPWVPTHSSGPTTLFLPEQQFPEC